MSPPVWLHCGDCKDCHPQLSDNHCQACRGPCSRTVELTSRSPPDVKNLFSDPADLIKPIVKTLDFQEKQKRNFLAGQTKRLAALDAKHREFLRQKEERIAAIEKAKMRLAQLHRDIAEKKEHLKNLNGDPREWSGRDYPVSQSSLYNQFPNEHQDKDNHQCDFFQTPKKRQDETYGVNDGGFLHLESFVERKKTDLGQRILSRRGARPALPVTTSLRDSTILQDMQESLHVDLCWFLDGGIME